jgi:hypothetical protein
MKSFQELADEAFRDLLQKYIRRLCGRAHDPSLSECA